MKKVAPFNVSFDNKTPLSTPLLQISHLNKVDPIDGQIRPNVRLRIEFLQRDLRNATGFYLDVIPQSSESTHPSSIEAIISSKKSMPDHYSVVFSVPIDGILSDIRYNLQLYILPETNLVFTKTQFQLPSFELPNVDCSSSEVEIPSRQKTVGRWSTAFQRVLFFPLHNSLSLTFFGAPPSYCIDSYRIQIRDAKFIPIGDDIIFSSKNLHLIGNTLIGTVELTDIQPNLTFNAIIEPFNSQHRCVCSHSCSCIRVQSQTLTSPIWTSEMDEIEFSHNLGISPITPIETSNFSAIFLIVSILAILGIIVISTRLLRRHPMKQTFLLLKTPNDEILNPSKSLKKDEYLKPTGSRTLLIISPNRYLLLERMAKIIEETNSNIVCLCPKFGETVVERNIHRWCSSAVQKADNILLFHSASKNPNLLYQMLTDFISPHNPNVLNICWTDEERTEICPPSLETVFLLPRDFSMLFATLRITLPSDRMTVIEDYLRCKRWETVPVTKYVTDEDSASSLSENDSGLVI